MIPHLLNMSRISIFSSVFLCFFLYSCNEKSKSCDEIAKSILLLKAKDSLSNSDFEAVLHDISVSKCDSKNQKKFLGTAYQIRHDYTLGKQIFVNIVLADSMDAYANFQLGKILFNEKKYDSSLSFLKRVVKINSVHGFAFEYNPKYLSHQEYLLQVPINEMLYYYSVSLYQEGFLEDSEWYFNLLESYNYKVDSVAVYLGKIRDRTKR